MDVWGGVPIYPPPAFFLWWYWYDAYAPRVFYEGAVIAAAGGFAAIGIAIGMSVWRAREAAGDLIGLIKRFEKLDQTEGPAALKVDVLRMRDQERCLEGREPERDHEFLVTDLARDVRRDLDLVAYALLVDGARIGDQKHLARPVPERVLQFSLPVVTAAQPQHVSPDLIPHGRQLCAEP